jgi:hypothetical protein
MPKTMDRKEFYRQEMIDEFKTIIELIEHEENLERQLYYFSAAYGMTQRTLRNDFSKEVLLMDLIFTNTHNLLIQRLNLLKNRDMVISPDILQKASKEVFKEFEILIKKFEENEPYHDHLMNILTAGFITSGSGNYLHEKGMID